MAGLCNSSQFCGTVCRNPCFGHLIAQDTTTAFWKGIVGYLGVVTFAFSLLVLTKSDVVTEAEVLPLILQEAYWTFSDAGYAEHWPTKAPNQMSWLLLGRALALPEQTSEETF